MDSRPRQVALLLTALLAGVGAWRREADAFLLAAVIAAGGLLFPPRKPAAWLVAFPVVAVGLWISSLDGGGCSAWWRGRMVYEKLAGHEEFVPWQRVWREALAPCHSGDLPGVATERLAEKVLEGRRCELYRTSLGDFWMPGPARKVLAFLVWEMTVPDEYASGDTGVEPGDIVIDGGAHVGVFTRYALGRGAARVIAIEPEPANAACLEANLAAEIAARRVTIVKAGIWDRRDSLPMSRGWEGNSGSASFVKPVPQAPVIEHVPLLPLDEIVDQLGIDRVDFIKMDIEGAERQALAGAVRTIQRFKPRMAICAYHLPDDPVVTPAIVRSAYAGYRIHAKTFDRGEGRVSPKVLFFRE